MYLPRLRDLREDHDMTQAQIAAILGIDQRVYSIYETGKRDIPLPHLVTLAVGSGEILILLIKGA